MEKTAHPTYAHCPIRHIVDRFGDKWSLLVLYNLHTSGCLRFSEIHRRTADISQKMLTSTLRKLEQDGLLSRKVYPEVPPRVEYALTPRGESLMPHLTALIGWVSKIRTLAQRATGNGKRPSAKPGVPKTGCRKPDGRSKSRKSARKGIGWRQRDRHPAHNLNKKSPFRDFSYFTFS